MRDVVQSVIMEYKDNETECESFGQHEKEADNGISKRYNRETITPIIDISSIQIAAAACVAYAQVVAANTSRSLAFATCPCTAGSHTAAQDTSMVADTAGTSSCAPSPVVASASSPAQPRPRRQPCGAQMVGMVLCLCSRFYHPRRL
jgi:hypothetical protein